MKALLLVALIATPAFAGELPLNAVYGTPVACQQFSEQGREGVLYGVPDDGELGHPMDPAILVTSREILGKEWGCTPDGDTLGSVSLSCSGEGEEEWPWTVNLSVQGETMLWKDSDGTLELHPCPVDEQGIM